MKQIIKFEGIPDNSTIEEGFGTIDYHDTYSVVKKTDKSAEEVSKELLRMPGWVYVLLFIRNGIVGLFGLNTEKKTTETDTFFTLIENRKEEVIMGEDDKHLNFRVSVMNDATNGIISLTTAVHYNNVWGRVYFFPVKPFHKIIMKTLFKQYLKNS